jgi:glycerol kinase
MTEHLLAIDQGTTNTKVLLVDGDGKIIARASRPLTQRFPHPAWVEQDPMEIWLSVRAALGACLEQAGHPGLKGLAITNQREAVLLWERTTGQPLGPCIGWQCRRTAPFCEELQARGLEPLLRERTGLTIDPLFSASKARWLLDHTENGRQRAERGELCLGTMDSWLLWNLTGGEHACDVSNASRTQLLNLHGLCWDEALLDIFGVPLPALPRIGASSAIYGQTIACGQLPAGVPIGSMIGDSHAALFGHASFQPGSVKATYGTGSSLMSPTRTIVTSERGISTTVAWGTKMPDGSIRATYALEGNILFTGAAVEWLGQILGLADPGQDIERLSAQVPDNGGVYLVPALAGLGAPHWSKSARGVVCGLTRGSSTAHLARAALEAIAYQVRDVLDVMEKETEQPLRLLLADGGASRNDLLMQFQADIIGRPVQRSDSPDLSALGAAYLAGLATGLWQSQEEAEQLAKHGRRFEPQMAEDERETLYAGWRQALARTLYEPTDTL